jgi:hypothetical protein
MTVAGCSCSVRIGNSSDSSRVDSSGVEDAISSKLAEQSGVTPSAVDCPEEMVAEEGKRYECAAVHPQDGPQRVEVTMHDDGSFDFFVPGGAPSDSSTS